MLRLATRSLRTFRGRQKHVGETLVEQLGSANSNRKTCFSARGIRTCCSSGTCQGNSELGQCFGLVVSHTTRAPRDSEVETWLLKCSIAGLIGGKKKMCTK